MSVSARLSSKGFGFLNNTLCAKASLPGVWQLTFPGTVETIENEQFRWQASSGKPGYLLEAWDRDFIRHSAQHLRCASQTSDLAPGIRQSGRDFSRNIIWSRCVSGSTTDEGEASFGILRSASTHSTQVINKYSIF